MNMQLKFIISRLCLICVSVLLTACSGSSDDKPKNQYQKASTEQAKVDDLGQYTCPAPKVVGYYQDKVGGFRDQRLDWSVDNINASVGLNMRFSQAVFLETSNALTCNYEWPNPEDPGTWIVVTVHLIPNAALQVILKGDKWQGENASKICSSRDPNDCRFNLARKKRA